MLGAVGSDQRGCQTGPFEDDVFRWSSTDVDQLIDLVASERPHILRRLESGTSESVLIPLADPPPIRVTSRRTRQAYFNFGELNRWRFLKTTGASLPFKDHQRKGIEWLSRRRAGILADDMGLGKTLQAIAALQSVQRTGDVKNALVVCPKSLIGTWEAELSLWAPSFCTVALHSSVSTREWRFIATQCHVAVINYEGIRQDKPSPGAFDLVICDEIHRLKNPKSLNHQSVKSLKPKFTWGLSGTPIEKLGIGPCHYLATH